MNFTVAELALAVGKSENYVRQHIHRNHLATLRVGRNVAVAQDEAARWARAHGLPFVLPARASVVSGLVENRIARMTVLTWHPKDARPVNLFTHIRHRQRKALGPWANEPDGTWHSEKVLADATGESEDLYFHSMDAPLEHCQEFVEQILNKGILETNGVEIDYVLEHVPRVHWAYRYEGTEPDISFRSPFSNHSAEVTEYWSFAAEARDRWLAVVGSRLVDLKPLLDGLGFPLDRLSDRVGNLTISGAVDAIDCDLIANKNGTLILRVEGATLLPDTYTATIWASHSGDYVVRRSVTITSNETLIDLRSEG